MKTLIKAAILVIVSVFIPTQVLAGESVALRMGADLTHHKTSTIYSLSWQNTFGSDFIYRGEVGGWTEDNPNHQGSPFGFVLLGKRFGDFQGLNATILMGTGFIGHTDIVLSSRLEFTEEVAIGYRLWSVGYKHISNAGLGDHNAGRDYIFMNFTIPLTE